jgi:hypothetical protein
MGPSSSQQRRLRVQIVQPNPLGTGVSELTPRGSLTQEGLKRHPYLLAKPGNPERRDDKRSAIEAMPMDAASPCHGLQAPQASG